MGSARPYSLRRRLVVGLLAAVAVVWLATAAYSYADARHEIDELLDAHLAQSAALIVAQAGHDLEEIEVERTGKVDGHARRVAFQIWERGTILRLRSHDAPASRLSQREQGYSDAVIDGKRWRVFSTWDARRRILVQMAERGDVRREIATGIAGNLLLPPLFALPVLALFIWLSVGRATRPLARLGLEVEGRQADDLRPLATQGVPREVVPLTRNLNALFERVARLIDHERRFTADAAHELRTPLAALKTQAQVARGARDEDSRRHALDGVVEGCDRAARLVDQLLTLARLEPDATRATAPCELAALAREVTAEAAPFALDRGVEVELRAPKPVVVEGHRALLSILLRNLVDNALRYSPPRSSVTIDVASGGEGTTIAVADEGPGVGPGERARLGERFYRVLGTGQSGSGLGLSIAKRIAEIHSARLRFEEGAGARGLRAVVEFPPAAASAPYAAASR